MLAETLQCGDRRNRNCSGLFEANVGKLRKDHFLNAHVFSECPAASAEGFIPEFEACDIFSYGFDNPGKIHSQARFLGFEKSVTEARKEQTGHSTGFTDVARPG
jgi:hypothetical protein